MVLILRMKSWIFLIISLVVSAWDIYVDVRD